MAGDITDADFCDEAIEKVINTYGQLDILVNNAGEHIPSSNLEEISREKLESTFKTNIFSMFYLTKRALKHLQEGSAIINTASIVAYKGGRSSFGLCCQ